MTIRLKTRRFRPLFSYHQLLLIFVFLLLPEATAPAQNVAVGKSPENASKNFRLERKSIPGGSELLTIWSREIETTTTGPSKELPLVSVLRDTLGDEKPENDRLRYLWMLTYTRPALTQQAAASIPFFYQRLNSKSNANSKRTPPPIVDLSATDREVWQRLFLDTLKLLLVDDPVLRASVNTYRRNVTDYKQAHIVRALAILSLYQTQTGAAPAFTPAELQEIQAHLMLTEKTLGGLVHDDHLQSYYLKQMSAARDTRGHNWELLRQRAEAEGLYFEPLALPDGSATHALVWVERQQLAQNQNRPYDSRFLNIKNPWKDEQLRRWQGYTGTRYFDAEHRPVEADAVGARAVEMIPLALYGLDYPKIPALLVDFRDGFNPKRREMSRRVLDDVARNILQISRFGDMYYFLGRTVYDFVTGRRGIDLNQPSRLRTYSQLKLLLSLSEDLTPDLRDQVNRRLEHVTLNPLENDLSAERELAMTQYKALMAYADRPDGLVAKVERDRRAEMVEYAHGTKAKIFFRAANVASFGLYTHREKADPEKLRQLDTGRQLAYHTRFLREVLKSTGLIEVVWNTEDVRRSLLFLTEHQESADADDLVRTTAEIYTRTQDSEIREMCLLGLRRIETQTAKNELQRLQEIANTEKNEANLRAQTESSVQESATQKNADLSSEEVKKVSNTITQ